MNETDNDFRVVSGQKELSFRIRVRLLTWLILFWLVASVALSVMLYLSAPQNTDPFTRRAQPLQILFIATGFGIAALTFYGHVKTAQAALKLQMEERAAAKKAYAMEMLRRWDAADFRQARESYREIRRLRRTLPETELVAKINSEANHRNSALDIANLFEDVEQVVNCGLGDEEVLMRGFDPLVKSINDTYSAWFQDLQEHDTRYYNQFQPFFNLLARWGR